MAYDSIFLSELLAQNGARPHLCDSNTHSHLKDERRKLSYPSGLHHFAHPVRLPTGCCNQRHRSLSPLETHLGNCHCRAAL